MFRRSTHRFAVASLAMVSLTVGLSACGGTDETKAPTTAAESVADAAVVTDAETAVDPTPANLSTAELIAQADRICDRVRAEMGTVAEPASFTDAEASFSKLLAISSKGVVDLQALPAAETDQATMAGLIGKLTEANGSLADAVTAAKAGNEGAANDAANRYGDAVANFATDAKAAGFNGCATGARSEGEATTTIAGGVLTVVNLGAQLKPVAGFDYEPLPAEAERGLINTFEQTSGIELMNAVGVTKVTNGTDEAIVILLGTTRPLVGDELRQFVTGVVGNGTDVQEITVAGTRGWAYVDGSGKQAFVTVRNDTAVLSIANTTDVLSTVVTGLFEANPNL